MRYIETFREGMHVSDVYLCKNKQIQLTKNGKEYGNLVLQDKTGTIDAKIWDLNSPGVGDFDTMDYVCIEADNQTLYTLLLLPCGCGVHLTGWLGHRPL